MSKPPLRDGDVLRQQVGVAVGLGLLAVEAGSGLGDDVAGEAAPIKSRRNHMPGGKAPRI
jgi:hypothetical protein